MTLKDPKSQAAIHNLPEVGPDVFLVKVTGFTLEEVLKDWSEPVQIMFDPEQGTIVCRTLRWYEEDGRRLYYVPEAIEAEGSSAAR